MNHTPDRELGQLAKVKNENSLAFCPHQYSGSLESSAYSPSIAFY